MTTAIKAMLTRSILNYYVALKLSAGAVATFDWPQVADDPAPIVRRYAQHCETRWDPRETVKVGDQVAVLTVPVLDGVSLERATILQN